MKKFYVACFLLLSTIGNTQEKFCESCTCSTYQCYDYACYPPQYYDLECDWGFFASVDFLYWFARETNLSYGLKVEALEALNTSPLDNFINVVPKENLVLKKSWDPGFRVGIGSNFSCDGWDIYLTWTYFRTTESRSTSVEIDAFNDESFPVSCSLLSPWGTPTFPITGSALSNDFIWFSKISASWNLRLNLFNLELGRKYWLSKCFSIRPYAGLGGTWTKILFKTTPILDTSFPPAVNPALVRISDFVKFKDRFWGVGLLGGIQPNWHLVCGFSLYGNSSIFLLWGKYKENRNEQVSVSIQSSDVDINTEGSFGTSKNHFCDMQAILDLGLGIRWESTFCCNSFHLNIDLGWEHQIWFDFVHRVQTIGTYNTIDPFQNGRRGRTFTEYNLYTSNLAIGGLVVRARFDF